MDWVADNAGMIGLLFFFSVFTGIVGWLYMPGMKKQIEVLGEIPLREDDHG